MAQQRRQCKDSFIAGHLPRHLLAALGEAEHDGPVPKANRDGSLAPCLLGVPGHTCVYMYTHAPTCASYMYIHAGQNQIGEPLPAIIRFRLLRDNGNLYDWPAEFGLRAAHSTVPVSFVCLPGLSAGDYFLSTPSHRSLLWSLSPHSCAFPLCNPAGSRHSLHFLFVSPWPCCDHHCRGSARPQEAQSRVSPRRPPTAPKGPRNPRSPVTHRRRRSPRSPRLRATLAALGRPNARHHPRRHSPP
jgi:hypothetical protein